jgi:hypothetical protein
VSQAAVAAAAAAVPGGGGGAGGDGSDFAIIGSSTRSDTSLFFVRFHAII